MIKELIKKKLELRQLKMKNKLEEKIEREKLDRKKREFERHFETLFSYSLENAVKRRGD